MGDLWCLSPGEVVRSYCVPACDTASRSLEPQRRGPESRVRSQFSKLDVAGPVLDRCPVRYSRTKQNRHHPTPLFHRRTGVRHGIYVLPISPYVLLKYWSEVKFLDLVGSIQVKSSQEVGCS